MLTYSSNKNKFMGQIRPFIDMYIRRTILNGSNPNKSSLNRGDIFHLKTISIATLGKKDINIS